jgi:Holliday junction DNA helicase RuvA
MIATLEGILAESQPLQLVVETGGVGYEVQIPLTTAERLPETGQRVKLYIHAVYREDSAALYGFSSREERDFFRVLTEKVSGIGPKIALNILSRMSVATLLQAIANSDVALLSKCQGIGKKTAERLIIELRDSATVTISEGGAIPGDSSETPNSETQDAVAALVALGFKVAEAEKAVSKALGALGGAATTEALVKQALQ